MGRSTSLLSFDCEEAIIIFPHQEQKESWPRKRAPRARIQSNEILAFGLATGKISASKHGAKATIVGIAVFTAMVIARKRKQRASWLSEKFLDRRVDPRRAHPTDLFALREVGTAKDIAHAKTA
jgi:hypothetical protein